LLNPSSRVTEEKFKDKYLILIELLEKQGLSNGEKYQILNKLEN
jgi:hypothetical protein